MGKREVLNPMDFEESMASAVTSGVLQARSIEKEMEEEDGDVLSIQKALKEIDNEEITIYVNRIGPNNESIPMDKIVNAKDVVDADIKFKLFEYGKAKGWPTGEYRFSLKAPIPGTKGRMGWICKPFVIKLDFPSSGTSSNPIAPDPKQQLRESVEFIKTMKDVMNPSPASDPAEIAKMISASFKNGMDVIKENMPKTPDQPISTSKDLIDTAKSLLELTKPPQAAPSADPMDMFMKGMTVMMGMMEKMMPKHEPRPEKSLAEQIAEIKALGLWPKEKDEESNDPVSQMQKLAAIREAAIAIAGGSGGGNGEAPSVWAKVVEIGLPVLGDSLGKGLGALQELFKAQQKKMDLQELEMKMKLGLLTKRKALANPAQEQPEEIQEEEGINQNEKPSSMQPEATTPQTTEGGVEEMSMIEKMKLVMQLRAAVSEENYTIFPEIAEKITRLVPNGEGMLGALIEDKMTAEQLQQVLNSQSYNQFTDDKTLTYANEFIKWLKSETIEQFQGILARCDKCQLEYEFDSVEEFNSISAEEHKCEGEEGQPCDGTIKLVPSI